MTAILVLVGIAVVAVGATVLIAIPFRHVEATAKSFPWHRSVRIGQRVWIRKKSKRQPRSSPDIRNVKALNANDPDKIRYTYEKRVWRNMRNVPASGSGHATVEDPHYTLGRDEQVRSRSESYEARFATEEGVRYSAKIRFTRWKTLQQDRRYRLGRNVFGRVRTVKPVPIERPAENAPHDA